MKITTDIITYNDLKYRKIIENDDYGIAAYMNESRRATFLNNPLLKDYDKAAMVLVRIDNIIVGRSMLYVSSCKIENSVDCCQAGSALEVIEKFRHLAVGADLMMYPLFSKDYKYIIYSGISSYALPLYKKLGFSVLEFRRMMYIRSTRCVWEAFKLKGMILKMTSTVSDMFFKPLEIINYISINKIYKKFTVKEFDIIPDWVDDITLNDGHKYMEVHDKKWFQWNLDHNFRGLKQDIQRFFGIYDGNKPIGFFMIKERFRKLAGGKLKNFILGDIVEWGTMDSSLLSETDINKLAISKFSKNVSIIGFASVDRATLKNMKRLGFINNGFAHIVFKDLTKQCKDSKDISLWRIRYGYSDVILT